MLLKTIIAGATLSLWTLNLGLAADMPQPDSPICTDTHCCVEFDTPNGGLVECYEREEQDTKQTVTE